jgi:hypothetical protein
LTIDDYRLRNYVISGTLEIGPDFAKASSGSQSSVAASFSLRFSKNSFEKKAHIFVIARSVSDEAISNFEKTGIATPR